MAIRFDNCGERPTVGSIASHLKVKQRAGRIPSHLNVDVESVIQAIKRSTRLSTGEKYFCPEVAERLEDWRVTTIPRSNTRHPVDHTPPSQVASSDEKMPDEKKIPRKKGTFFIGDCGDEPQAVGKKEEENETTAAEEQHNKGERGSSTKAAWLRLQQEASWQQAEKEAVAAAKERQKKDRVVAEANKRRAEAEAAAKREAENETRAAEENKRRAEAEAATKREEENLQIRAQAVSMAWAVTRAIQRAEEN